MIVSHRLGGRCLRYLATLNCALTAMLTIGLMAASEGLAIPPPPPFENKGLAIVHGGVLRFDQESLLLEGPHSVIRRLGASLSEEDDDFSSSASATAALVEKPEEEPSFVASVLPRRLSAIAQPQPLSGAGCTWWEPSRPYVVVEDELVATGKCQEVTEHPVREPLFIRDLRGGRWTILRWLAGVPEPRFAAEGPLLAIGSRRFDRLMAVSILDLSTGATQADFETPPGQLAFASPQRLVVETPDRVNFTEGRPVVRLRLYSTRGSYLANLGSMTEPLISGMHIVAYEKGRLFVRRVADGAPRSVIGFNPPARRLAAFAFRWPDLVVSETTSKSLLPSEVRCWSGSYGRSSQPFLARFNLARIRPFDAPPATVEVKPAVPLTNCGPAPP